VFKLKSILVRCY